MRRICPQSGDLQGGEVSLKGVSCQGRASFQPTSPGRPMLLSRTGRGRGAVEAGFSARGEWFRARGQAIPIIEIFGNYKRGKLFWSKKFLDQSGGTAAKM
jgi:hypothetical protein